MFFFSLKKDDITSLQTEGVLTLTLTSHEITFLRRYYFRIGIWSVARLCVWHIFKSCILYFFVTPSPKVYFLMSVEALENYLFQSSGKYRLFSTRHSGQATVEKFTVLVRSMCVNGERIDTFWRFVSYYINHYPAGGLIMTVSLPLFVWWIYRYRATRSVRLGLPMGLTKMIICGKVISILDDSSVARHIGICIPVVWTAVWLAAIIHWFI